MIDENQINNDNITVDQNTLTQDSSDKRNGKAVFALHSLTSTDGKEIHDGYLLFKNPDNAMEIVKMCKQNILESQLNPNRTNNFGKKTFALYKPFKWININEFYAGNVLTKGSFYVRNLDNCCDNILQDETFNDDKTHAIFQFFPEPTSNLIEE